MKTYQDHLIKQVWKLLNSRHLWLLSPEHLQHEATVHSAGRYQDFLFFFFCSAPSCTLLFPFKRRCQKWSWLLKGSGFISCTSLWGAFCCGVTGDLIMKLSCPINPESLDPFFLFFVPLSFPPQCRYIPSLAGQCLRARPMSRTSFGPKQRWSERQIQALPISSCLANSFTK